MTEITVEPHELPEDAALIDLKLEAARLAATSAYLSSVLQAALFDEITDEVLQEVREAIIRFPLIYSARVTYRSEISALRVMYMTWDDYAHTSRNVRILDVTPDVKPYEAVVAADR